MIMNEIQVVEDFTSNMDISLTGLYRLRVFVTDGLEASAVWSQRKMLMLHVDASCGQ